MLGSEYLDIWARVATVVVPVAIYFLVLGLLNSRRHPQLLTGRRDFALLIAALSPLFALPALSLIGVSLPSVVGVVAAVAAGILLLAPKGGSWVVYNIPPDQARRAIDSALDQAGMPHSPAGRGFRLHGGNGFVQVSDFPLLRNVSIRLRGADEQLARRFEERLGRIVAGLEAETSPMAVALLLVATAMLVAPLSMVAHRAGEIVRLLTDLLH